VGYKNVRDTSAKAERRPVVRTRLVCGPLDREIDVTVTDRSGMIFRMILGRQALAGQVLVDAGRGYTTRAAAATRKARR
jgi:ribosomal protein S6--L-glutamate ligase